MQIPRPQSRAPKPVLGRREEPEGRGWSSEWGAAESLPIVSRRARGLPASSFCSLFSSSVAASRGRVLRRLTQ
eukprot:3921795-Rhodomonas_salina.1